MSHMKIHKNFNRLDMKFLKLKTKVKRKQITKTCKIKKHNKSFVRKKKILLVKKLSQTNQREKNKLNLQQKRKVKTLKNQKVNINKKNS